ncbi:hypothetical protein PoB_004229900 [Plakobranchus ocellatus]|uniref:Uncharacterized protein n=1 Tax=Plakobranchus ocellatus TaxID=259542 RepID=A0AAV4BBQ7_9GAST|nr:hypothetical protein PoB_004229900 [Plakobranchus ocellatus]
MLSSKREGRFLEESLGEIGKRPPKEKVSQDIPYERNTNIARAGPLAQDMNTCAGEWHLAQDSDVGADDKCSKA